MSLNALREQISVELSDQWHEAPTNMTFTPVEFPVWRVDFAGKTIKGGRWLTTALISILVDFSEGYEVVEELEHRVEEMITVIRGSKGWLMDSVSGSQLISFGSSQRYFGATITVIKT